MITWKRGGLIGMLGIFFWLCLWGIGATAVNARPQLSASAASLVELDLGLSAQTLKEWYTAQSGNPATDNYFGVYVTLPVTDTLYIGLASARPAEDSGDGAYFARFDGSMLTGIARPNEQGFHEMLYDGTVIHIAGTDPHIGDNHSAGNHYIYTPTTGLFTKYRDPGTGLSNVFHTWGLWMSDTVLYAAVSAHNGTYTGTCTAEICMGKVFTSTDRGATWTWMSDLGGYRAYDITGFQGDLFAIANDELGGALSMYRSADGGQTWGDVPGLQENIIRVHMAELANRLLAVSFDRTAFSAVEVDGAAITVTTHTLPSNYRVGATYSYAAYTDYKVLTVAKGYLYLIAQSDATEVAILRTADLENWERMAQTEERLISLSYWEDKDWLVAASAGTQAKLWYMDLGENPSALTARAFRAGPVPWPALLAVGGLVSWLGLWRYPSTKVRWYGAQRQS